ncbi:hypothetical protein KR222_011175 [Zaprionus bogoriensis]|nr:hypothetical protein KR222_011175 [Zaprionus bogoriensis]
MINFLRGMPKVELHAHLNGSLNIDSIKELAEKVYGPQTEEFSALCQRFVKFDKGADLNDCFEKFGFVHELTSTRRGLHYATELVMRDFAKDNVMYLELRTTPKANGHMSRREYLQTVLESMRNASKKYPITVKLLPSINRAESVAAAHETVELALELRQEQQQQESDDYIVGIDFSGNPHRGKFADFKPALEMARNGGLKLAIHCAEIANPLEVREMLQFGMSRCGHGTYLTGCGFEHMREQNIPIECCLTSNVKSGTVSSIASHHLAELMKADAPKVLCTDDAGVFDTSLSEEYVLASEALGLTRSQCIALNMEAVQHAFATPQEKLMMKMKVYEYIRRHSD